MANPFLFTEEEMAEEVPAQETFANPFLMDDTGDDDDAMTGGQTENPFFSDASNPFADLQQSNVDSGAAATGLNLFMAQPDDEPEAINTSFFDTTINDADDAAVAPPIQISGVAATDMIYSSEDELEKAKKPGPPPRPGPPIAAQHLISTVAGQLDLASHDLLGRIPVTRTPSPVSMRDLHSPSPTPEENLLDYTAEQMDEPVAVQEVAKPARPPPRPNPPPKPEPPAVVAAPVPVAQEADIMDMFGVEETAAPTRPPPPKSKEDILSLFSAPAAAAETQEESPHDLMSDEIPAFQPEAPTNNENKPEIAAALIEPNINLQQEEEPPQRPEPILESFMETAEPIQESPVKIPEIVNKTPPERHPFVTTPSPPPAPVVIEAKIASPVSNPFADIIEPAPVPTPIPTPAPAPFAAPAPVPTPIPIPAPAPVAAPAPAPAPARPAPPKRPAVPPPPAVAAAKPLPMMQPVAEPLAQPFVPSPVVAAPIPVAVPAPVIVQQQQPPVSVPSTASAFGAPVNDEFDAFSAKFNSAQKVEKTNIFLEDPATDAWGDDAASGFGDTKSGFGGDEDGFDTFLAMSAPPPSMTAPSNTNNYGGADGGMVIDTGRANPFDNRPENLTFEKPTIPDPSPAADGTESLGSPQTPLFDDDVSQPLEDFPRISMGGSKGWEMQLRQPNKKKITGQRFWKKVHVRLVFQGDNPVIQLLNAPTDKEPFQELPLQASYSVSEISAQQYDQFGKIFTVKLQYIFYKERAGIRPGQVTKAERITNKLSQFAAYAIQGDYQGVKEFGSDLKKLGLPVEHAPQVSELFKIGSMNYEDLKQFSICVEEALFKMNVHRDRAMTYKMEEVQVTAVDEIYVEQDHEGRVLKQIARVRLFLLGFLTGMPTIELGVNDMWRQGKEVVGRHDIIPVATEEWIRLEGVEFHGCVQQDHYELSRTIKFQPPDACYIELMRFRVRPPKNRELPLQVKATWCVNGNRVELRVDILVPGFASRKLGQIPCEDVAIRFPIPECWIYLFRVEKHFRYGSVKSAHRRTGKIKGIERILGTVDQLQESLIEVTSGQAKYEHHHRAIVWRCPRLPKDGQGAYTTHQMVCRMALTSFDQIPEQLAPYCYVEFTMPATQVSHTTVRSVSIQESDSDDPPEKYVRYLARHEYRVGIEHTTGETVNSYLAATSVSKKPIKEEPEPAPAAPAVAPPSESDSDSN